MATAVTPFQSPSTVARVPVVVAAVGFSPVAVKVMGMPSDASGSRPASSCVQAVNRVAARQAADNSNVRFISLINSLFIMGVHSSGRKTNVPPSSCMERCGTK